MKSNNFIIWRVAFSIVASSAAIYSTYIALYYSSQLPLDAYAFRQTQTALTAYWFLHDGFRIAYETPVAGAPWSIPFEFPLYQLVVALVSRCFGASLDSVGRVVSYVFLVACLVPARSITNKLRFNRSVFYIFSALILSSPIYVYWGRSFMIETAALLFSVLAISSFVDALVGGFCWRRIVLFSVFMSVSLLQKSTTALPVLGGVFSVYLWFEINQQRTVNKIEWGRVCRVIFVCFFIPVVFGCVWVAYTDIVKGSNSLGTQLTSGALAGWNLGTLEQRMSRQLFVEVFWGRIVAGNFGGWLGVFLIAVPLLVKSSPRLKIVSAISVILGIAPLFIFTNLHIVHSYYQTANVIFLAYAIALSLGEVVLSKIGGVVTLFALSLVMLSNYQVLYSGYLPIIKASFGKDNRDVAVGEILRREIPDGGQFVAFGNDWSSSFSYIAHRKSFTVPDWFNNYSGVINEPERFVDKGKLGAVVSCVSRSESVDGIFKLASKNLWKVGETHGCLVATPKTQFSLKDAAKVRCQGSIDYAKAEQRGGVTVVAVGGWTTMHGTKIEFPSYISVAISKYRGDTLYAESLRVPRLDVTKSLGSAESDDAGFSVLVPMTLDAGEYFINVVQSNRGKQEICQYDKRLVIKSD